MKLKNREIKLAISRTALRTSFAALAVSLAAGCATIGAPEKVQDLGPAGAVDPRFKELSEHMGAQSAARCNPAFDGDARRGEITNLDLTSLMAYNQVKQAFAEFEDDRVGTNLATLAQNDWVFCVDNRLRGMTDSKGRPVTAMIHVANGNMENAEEVGIVSISPIAPNPKQARATAQLAMVDAAEHVTSLFRILGQAQIFAQAGDPAAQKFILDGLFKPVGVTLDITSIDTIEKSQRIMDDAKLNGITPPGKAAATAPANALARPS